MISSGLSLLRPFDILPIERLLQHRLQSVETLIWALQLRSDRNSASPIFVLIDGRLTIEGALPAITNPMLEAGFSEARAQPAFLGLCKRGGMECFENADGPLRMLPPDVALSRYEGQRHEAENAFLRTFHIANKGPAPTTSAFRNQADDDISTKIACRGIPALLDSDCCTPRGMLPPNPAITKRSHPAA